MATVGKGFEGNNPRLTAEFSPKSDNRIFYVPRVKTTGRTSQTLQWKTVVFHALHVRFSFLYILQSFPSSQRESLGIEDPHSNDNVSQKTENSDWLNVEK